ncbi:hypothetical protein ACFQU2_16150 [Siccirubricoccus deserti]
MGSAWDGPPGRDGNTAFPPRVTRPEAGLLAIRGYVLALLGTMLTAAVPGLPFASRRRTGAGYSGLRSCPNTNLL